MKTRLLVVSVVSAAAAVLPAAPAQAIGGSCTAVSPGLSSCSYYANSGVALLTCEATSCTVRVGTSSRTVGMGQITSFVTPCGTRVTLSVNLGVGTVGDDPGTVGC